MASTAVVPRSRAHSVASGCHLRNFSMSTFLPVPTPIDVTKSNEKVNAANDTAKPYRLMYIVFLCSLLGIGLEDHTLFHGIPLLFHATGCLTTIIYYSIMHTGLSQFTSILSGLLQLIVLYFLLQNRSLIKNFFVSTRGQLNERNSQRMRFLDICFASIVLVKLIPDIIINFRFHDKLQPFDNEIINGWINCIWSIQRAFIDNWISIVVFIYMLAFISLYSLMIQSVDRMFILSRTGDLNAMLHKSLELKSLVGSFETCHSFIPFLCYIWAVTRFILLITEGLSEGVNGSTLIYAYAALNIILHFVALVVLVSLLQEKIVCRGGSLHKSLLLACFDGQCTKQHRMLMEKIQQTYSAQVTVWKMYNISRGILISELRSILALATLFFQAYSGYWIKFSVKRESSGNSTSSSVSGAIGHILANKSSAAM